MSEALADLGRLTRNSSWVQLAALFERPCFVGALARSGGAADAIERLHANTHLPQILGSAARYEVTGESSLRRAVESFWDEVRTQHTFATGGSTTGEVWLRAGILGDAVAPQRKDNYWAHDQAETCVAHNSMRVSRRLLQWSPWAAWDRPLQHAGYYERTLYNAVLGTQRGSNPGEMLYMFPMGSGVSKAGIPDAPQGHHWSDAEHHFWCCQGSGIEAFARLADSIYWKRGAAGGDPARAIDPAPAGAHHLLVLQLLPSSLLWKEAGIRASVQGDYPGAVAAAAPIRVRLRVERITPADAAADASQQSSIEVGVRLPSWVSSLRMLPLSGALTLAQPLSAGDTPQPGSLLHLRLSGDSTSSAGGGSAPFGMLEIEMQPAITWEQIKDTRAHFQILHACLFGPLVLAGFTYAERALPINAALLPVPPGERKRLASLRIDASGPAGAKAEEGGCLVKRWSSAWVIRPDRTRHFLPRPPAECIARATPIEDSLSAFPQAHGGGKGYALDEEQITSACARFDGCVLPEGKSAFADGRLYMMHLGSEDSPIVLAAPPPLVTGGPRKGGTDAANAATWRLTEAPIGIGALTRGSAGGFYIESFDMPGHVLAPAKGGTKGEAATLSLQRVSAMDAAQLWHKTPAEGADGASSFVLRSGGAGGGVLSARKRTAAPRDLVVPHRGTAISREWELVLMPTASAADARPVTIDLPYAEYATTSFWLTHDAARANEQASLQVDRASKVRPFLLVPLNELQDEHYTVYWCKPKSAQDAARPPRFCI